MTKPQWVVTGYSEKQDGILFVVRAGDEREALDEVAKHMDMVLARGKHWEADEDDPETWFLTGGPEEGITRWSFALDAVELEEGRNLYEAVQW